MNQNAWHKLQPWLWIFPLLAALLSHLNVLQNGPGWDDEHIFSTFRTPEHWWTLFNFGSTAVLPFKEAATYYRPLITASYLIDYSLWGNNPFGFHLSVLVVHGINTVMVFFLSGNLAAAGSAGGAALASPGKTAAGPSRFLPLVAASLFAVHPVHTEAVAWIAGRNDVFCTAFMLSSLLLYIRFHKTGNGWAYFLSMSCFVLALTAKETATGLFLLFPLLDYFSGSWFRVQVSRPMTYPDSRRRFANSIHPGGWGVMRFLIQSAILSLYLLTRHVKISDPYGTAFSQDPFSYRMIYDAVRAAGLYVEMMLIPFPHRLFIASVPSSLLFLVLSALSLILLMVGFLLALIRRQTLAGMGLALTFVLLAPAIPVAVLPVAAAPAAERYVYAPSIGAVILLSWLVIGGLDRLQKAVGGPPRVTWVPAGVLGMVLVCSLGWESWNRNSVWKSPLTFWQAASVLSPDAGTPQRELGKRYSQMGKYTEAEQQYRQAITAYELTGRTDRGEMANALNGLGELYYNLGRYAEAEPLYRRAIELYGKTLFLTDLANSINNLAVLSYTQGKYTEAESLYQRALTIRERALGPEHPDVAQVYNNLAALYDTQKRYAEAETLYRRSLAIREKAHGPDHPDVAQVLNNLGLLYYTLGRYSEAEPLYRRAADIYEKSPSPNPADLANSLNNLAVLLEAEGNFTEADALYRRAIGHLEKILQPDHPILVSILQNHAALLQRMKREEDADSVKGGSNHPKIERNP